MKNKSGEMKEVNRCNCYVYLDMESLEAEKTKLTQTIVIQMPNFGVKFLTVVIGGETGKKEYHHVTPPPFLTWYVTIQK